MTSQFGVRAKNLHNIFENRDNGLNLIRIGCALIVLISHVGWFAGEDIRWVRMLGPKAVAVFFGLSGFLLLNSWTRSDSPSKFFRNRLLRIWPALLAVLIVTSFVFFPVYLKINGLEYSLSNIPNQLTYIFSNMFVHQSQSQIANSPNTHNVLNWNPSLWTLEFEICCYLFTPIIAKIVTVSKKPFLFMSFVLVCSIIPYFSGLINQDFTWFIYFFQFLSYYSFGALLSFYANRIVVSSKRYWIVLFIILAVVVSNKFESILNYMLVIFALFIGSFIKSKYFARNDFSYGIYIYSGPITHIVISSLRNMQYSFVISCLLSSLFTGIFAYISWFVFEKPALNFKK